MMTMMMMMMMPLMHSPSLYLSPFPSSCVYVTACDVKHWSISISHYPVI